MRKRIVHILLLLLCTASTALCQSVNDTILIDMVTITPFERISPSGEKVDSFDSLSLKAATYKNIGEFLAHNSNVIIKNYGTEGMTSSLSLRGAGNTRTQILWEGLSLNAISNGENNLSLVPISCFDNITINYGASATNFGNGTFGGAINLKSTPLFKKHASAQVFASYGSFKTYKTNVGYSVGTEKIQYKGGFFYSQSESDFEYYDYIRLETLKRKNADYFKYGTIQNLHIKFNDKLQAQAALWYQVNDANLPSIMGNVSNEVQYQSDSSLRALVSLQYNINSKNKLSYKTAYIDDYELYTHKASPQVSKYMEYSKIQTCTSQHFLQFIHKEQTQNAGTFIYEAELQGKIAQADVTNYGGKKKESSFAGILQCNHFIDFKGGTNVTTGRLYTQLSIRKEFNTQYSIPFIVNIGSEYHMNNRNENPLIIRFSTGNKYRTPTFNDLYWVAWGNPELLPEYGFSIEFGIRKSFFSSEKWYHITTDITAYHSILNDMIMWTPAGAVWHPMNTAQAVLQGLEFSLEQSNTSTNKPLQFSNKLQVNVNNPHITKMYDTTETTNSQESESVGHILYYVPRLALHFQPHISYRNWELSVFVNYEGKRYFNLEKTLDAYTSVDVNLKKSFELKNAKLAVGGQIRNLTDATYEQVRSYPLPGRNFEIYLQCLIN